MPYYELFTRNFVGLSVAMILFFAPFLAIFTWRQRIEIWRTRPHFNYYMERFFLSREANWLVFFWAAGEAIAWFIIPEFLLFLMVFMRVDRKLDLVKYDIAGTLVGSLIALWFRLPQQVFEHLPYVRPKMFDQVHHWYATEGVWALIHQPFSGVPYKVFLHEATNYQLFIPALLIIAIIARMVRYIILYQATVLLYPLLHKFVRRHYAILFVVAALIFTALLTRVVQEYS